MQGLAAGAISMSRARSSPESSHSGGSTRSSPEAAGPVAPAPFVGLLPSSSAAGGFNDGGSSFVLAASRLPAVPAVLPGWGTAAVAVAGVSSVVADAAALAQQSGGPPAVDRAEPPGALPVNAISEQQTQHGQHAQQALHRMLPPLSPASSPQLRRNTSSSTAASIDSRGMGHVATFLLDAMSM